MKGPGDGARFLLTLLFSAWIMAFAYAFVAYAMTPFDMSSGFLRGSNRPGIFLGWQGVAGVIAVAIFGVSRQWPRGAAVRKLGALPLILAVLLILGILGVVFWAGYG